MKTIFYTFLLISFAFVSDQLSAQNIKLKGGLNYSSVSWEYYEDNYSDKYKYGLGFQLGSTVDILLSEYYSIDIGAIIMLRKFKYIKDPTVNNEITYEWNTKYSRWYCEIPVMLRREFRVKQTRLFGEIGAYTGIGLKGKGETKIYADGEILQEGSSDVTWGTKEGEINRFDFGLGAGIGMVINKLEIGICYKHGLVNTIHEEGKTSKNRTFMLNCAYPIFSFK